jgi:hypothetical protein
MRKDTVSLVFGTSLILCGILSLRIFLITGCSVGRWRFGSCGKEAWVIPAAFLIGGILTIVIVFLNRKNGKDQIQNKQINVICPSCEKVYIFNKNDETINRCSKCHIDLVLLEGFYDKNKPKNDL